MTVLRQCQKCGGNPSDRDYGQEYWVECEACGFSPGKFRNRFCADVEWNSPVVSTRDAYRIDSPTPTQGADARLAELEAENTALRHDIERHIANHAADLNAIVSDQEKFETWAKSEEYDLRPPLYDKDRAYVSPMTNAVWIGWQAARATAEQSAFALQALVAAGHVSQAKVEEALSIAAKTPGIRAADRDSVIEECAKEADDSAAQYARQARGGDNSGASDHMETAAQEIASDIRALKSQQDAAIEAKRGDGS